MDGRIMTKQYTDADVARMLGWKFIKSTSTMHGDHWYLGEDAYIVFDLPTFGLSTPPGPDADANAARYVKPWMREQLPGFQILVRDALIKFWYDGAESPNPSVINIYMWLVNVDSPTLCRACLQVMDASA